MKVKSVEGSSCKELKVLVDLSECGGDSSKPAQVDSCSDGVFKASVKHNSMTYHLTGNGKAWGGSVKWKPEEVTIATNTEKMEKPAKANVATTESPKKSKNPEKKRSLSSAETTTPSAVPSSDPAPFAAVPAATPAKPEFKPNYNFFGDIRHRSEVVYNENSGAGKEDRYEQLRLRARLGVKAQPTEDLSLEFRMATGPGGISTNQTYGESPKGMRNYDFKLDRASAKWVPVPYGSLLVGRTGNPFQFVGGNDLIYDADLNFDGSTVSLEHKISDFFGFLKYGQFVIDEAKDTQPNNDVNLYVSQAGIGWNATNDLKVTVVGSLHRFTYIKDHAAISGTDFAGNSNQSSKYTNDYNISSVGLEVQYNWLVPLIAFYDTARNTEAQSEDTASIIGLKVNRLKAAGDWFFGIDQRTVRKDAILGILTDGDSFGGGTNGQSLRINLGYAINTNFNIAMSQFTGKKYIADGETSVQRDRTQFDLNFSF